MLDSLRFRRLIGTLDKGFLEAAINQTPFANQKLPFQLPLPHHAYLPP